MKDPKESGVLIALLLPFLLNSDQRFKVNNQSLVILNVLTRTNLFLCALVLQKYEEDILLSISSLVATADNVTNCYRSDVIHGALRWP